MTDEPIINGMTDEQRQEIKRLAKEVALAMAELNVEYSPAFLFVLTELDGKPVTRKQDD